MADGDENDMPRDAKIVKELLKSMNVDDYEPRVIHHFLELWYRHAVDVLVDAQVYSEHAGKSTIDLDDVKLAIHSAVGSRFSQPPSREMLLDLAKSRNRNPLPKATPGPGMPLPPEEDTLISPNFQLALPRKQNLQPMEEAEDDEDSVDPNPKMQQNTNSTSEERRDFPQGGAHQRVSFPLGGAKHSR